MGGGSGLPGCRSVERFGVAVPAPSWTGDYPWVWRKKGLERISEQGKPGIDLCR